MDSRVMSGNSVRLYLETLFCLLIYTNRVESRSSYHAVKSRLDLLRPPCGERCEYPYNHYIIYVLKSL